MKSDRVFQPRNGEGQGPVPRARLRDARSAVLVLASCNALGCWGEAWSPDADEPSSPSAERPPAQASVVPNATPTVPAGEPVGAWGLEAPTEGTASPRLPTPTPSWKLARNPISVGAGGLIYTWGGTGILYRDEPGNLRLIGNVLSSLAASPASGSVRILYTADCDPREHANLCQITSNAEMLTGFFDMIAEHGSVTFDRLFAGSAKQYDAVIYDACAAGAGSPAQLRQYLAEGGRALILADNFCNSSAELMNDALPDFGLSFSAEDPIDPGLYAVPLEARTGLLEGVEMLDIFRVAPQLITHSFAPVVESPNGILMARREGPTAP
jgi:hypothetical protein